MSLTKLSYFSQLCSLSCSVRESLDWSSRWMGFFSCKHSPIQIKCYSFNIINIKYLIYGNFLFFFFKRCIVLLNLLDTNFMYFKVSACYINTLFWKINSFVSIQASFMTLTDFPQLLRGFCHLGIWKIPVYRSVNIGSAIVHHHWPL